MTRVPEPEQRNDMANVASVVNMPVATKPIQNAQDFYPRMSARLVRSSDEEEARPAAVNLLDHTFWDHTNKIRVTTE
jgi:hypothetical protein